MKNFKLGLSIIALFVSIVSRAQTKDMKDEAMYFFSSKNYAKAYELYDKLLISSPKNFDYKFRLGYCCLFYPEKKARAIEIFEDIKISDKSPEADYYLAKAYHINYKFDKAIVLYESFLKQKTVKVTEEDKAFIEDAKVGLTNCKNGKELVLRKVVAEIKNIGSPVNTAEAENGPVISADQSILIYTYVGKQSTGGLLNDVLKPDEIEGTYHEDIYISTKNSDSTWSIPHGISILNSLGHDAVVAISSDGNTLFTFVSSEKNPGDLYQSNKQNNEWTKAKKLNSNINSEFWEGSCSISSDGRYLFFASERPGGYGKRDLYVSELENGDWGVAKNLGPIINTEQNEDDPFIHPNGITMFFSSEGHKSIGGYDIMYSIKKDNNEWIEPMSMGIPLNTTEDDRAYVVSADGNYGYFSSNRGGVGGKGEQDIYIVMPGIVGDQPIVALLKGSVFANNKPVEAKIEIVKVESNQAYTPYYSNSVTGNFLLALTPGNNYKVKITVAGFDPIEDVLNIDNLQKFIEIKKDFYVYSPDFEPKKNQVPLKNVLDSLLKKESNPDVFKNDAISAQTNKTKINKAKAVDAKSAIAKNEKTPKTETIKKGKKELIAKTEEVSKPDTLTVSYNPTTTPCSESVMPDLSALKGKSLNDPLIYKQLLNLAGSVCPEGIIFKVQIGAYRMPKNFTYKHLKKFGQAEVVDYPDGITRFTQLSYKTIIDAEKSRQEIIATGQKDAWITAFINGKRYTLEELIAVNFNNKQIN